MDNYYVDLALTSNQVIRLLDISPGQLGEQISCSFYTVTIDAMQP